MDAARRPSLLDGATLVALFLAALLASLRLAGTSPIVWIDTFNDEYEVQHCLVDDSCTLSGVQTSVPGQVHAVAWLEERTLLAWLGAGLDGTHIILQLLNALAAVLVFVLATRLAGPLAGVAAVWILMDRIHTLVRATALYNTAPLLFLGAVFLVACTAVVERPGSVSVALAALLGAVMANVHLACVLTGASVVWVALTAPRRRFLLAALGAGLFGLGSVAMAPPGWLHNLYSLLQHRAANPEMVGKIAAHDTLVSWMLFAVSAWVVSFASRAPAWVEYRRRAQGAIAVIVPFLAAFLVAPRFGLHAESKYLFHLKPACAVAAALPLGLVAGAALRALSARVLVVVERLAPFALAAVIALTGGPSFAPGFMADDERVPTVADLAATARILRVEHGWDDTHLLRGLKTPYGITVLSGLRLLAGAADSPSAVQADDGSSALLMKLEAEDLPQPLPSNWRIVSRSARAVTVLVFMQSHIDWSKLEVCVQPADGSPRQCDESGWRFDSPPGIAVPGMPPTGVGWRGMFQLSFALRPAARGFTEQIFMPRMRSVCGGRIASVPGDNVGPDRRGATIAMAETGANASPTITLEWEIGSPECDPLAYDSLPPFVVAGDSRTVQLLEAILRRREG